MNPHYVECLICGAKGPAGEDRVSALGGWAQRNEAASSAAAGARSTAFEPAPEVSDPEPGQGPSNIPGFTGQTELKHDD